MTNEAQEARRERAARLADQDGMIMVSIDHRESLRTMMAAGLPVGSVLDHRLRDFKTAAARALGPHASALLIDPQFGVEAMAARPEGTRLIVSGDVLLQDLGGPVRGSAVNDSLGRDHLATMGADALKLLVIWRRGEEAGSRRAMVSRFLDRCGELGVTSLIEGLTRPDGDTWTSMAERHEAILAAADELCAEGPDVYKTEVPGYAPEDLSAVARQSEELSAVVGGPWVVLSSGVRAADYPVAVEQACRGGADGFLAGRALWGDILGSAAVEPSLHTTSVERLEACRAAVVRGRSLAAARTEGGVRAAQ